MNRREVYKFFEVQEEIQGNSMTEDEVDGLFFSLMDNWNELKGPFALKMIQNYKKTDNEKFKKKIMDYTAMVLLEPSVVSQNQKIIDLGPLILLKNVEAESYNNESLRLYDFIQDLVNLLEENTSKSIIIPIIYECSRLASKFKVCDLNFQTWFDTIRMILTVTKICEWFKDSSFWGLKDTNLKIDTSNYYRSFVYDTNIPCFLDGLLEVYLYEKDELYKPVEILLEQDKTRKQDIILSILKGIEIHNSKLYDIVFLLVKYHPDIKNNFLKYVLMTIRKNLDRNKISFDEQKVISDGFAYNMNNLLLLFSTRIVKGNLSNLIDINFFKQVN
ncbi:Ubiquitin fusion degradation protein-2, partial [Pseudoloma neurophilia]